MTTFSDLDLLQIKELIKQEILENLTLELSVSSEYECEKVYTTVSADIKYNDEIVCSVYDSVC